MSDPKRMLALIVSNGSHNNMVMVANLILAAVACNYQARVFFRDEAVLKLAKDRIDQVNLSPTLGPVQAKASEFFHRPEQSIAQLFQQAKQCGDVQLYVCSSSLQMVGLTQAQLIEGIDKIIGVTTFLLDHLASADLVLSF